MDYNVIYYYNVGGITNYIEDKDDTNTLKFIDVKELNKPIHKFHSFGLFEQYTKCYEDLIKFKVEFTKCCDEIKNIPLKTKLNKYYRIDYKKFHSHNDAVLFMFKNKITNELFDSFKKVSKEEFYIFERCLNSGLICLNLDYKNKPTKCYGYDFSRYYANMFQKISIPKSQGVVSSLEKVEFGKLKFGIYRVYIKCSNQQFSNMFNFKDTNHYTSQTLNYLHRIKDKFNIEFELLPPTEEFNYNALTYEYADLIEGKDLFGNWFNELELIRTKCPNNRLVKHLMSSLWGTLVSYNKVYLKDISLYDATYKQDSEDSEYKILDNKDDEYISVRSDNAYNHGLARMKPFLTAFCRNYIMKFLLEHEINELIIRIHTDGIVLSKKVDFTNLEYYPKPEDKTTGLINWHNSLFGFHICKKCKREFRYKDYLNHLCEL